MKTIWMRELTLLSCLFKQPYSVVSGLFRPVLILPPARRFRPRLPPVGMVAGICINYSPYHYLYYKRRDLSICVCVSVCVSVCCQTPPRLLVRLA